MPRPKSKALAYLYDRFIGGDPERVASYEKELETQRRAIRRVMPADLSPEARAKAEERKAYWASPEGKAKLEALHREKPNNAEDIDRILDGDE